MTLFNNIYKGRRVFVTGHAGFKGSWLTLWLAQMGAIVKGYSLYPWTGPSHWNLLNLDIESINHDIGDYDRLLAEMQSFQPEIVFHLTAQAIVLKAYENPIETYQTNVMGTLKLLEACRHTDSVRAIVNVTSDKCYDNKEWPYRYRETDAVGGYDPYSSSKGCVELLTASYRKSYWPVWEYEEGHNVLIATVRAGNVIGGGDWARDRLVPNTMRAVQEDKPVYVRDSRATRPWMHVLDALSGYLLVGQKLFEGYEEFSKPWNFGPADENSTTVVDALKTMQQYWPEIKIEMDLTPHAHEALLLNLDCSQAIIELKWRPIWETERVFAHTAIWYRRYLDNNSIISSDQITQYIIDATQEDLIWIR